MLRQQHGIPEFGRPALAGPGRKPVVTKVNGQASTGSAKGSEQSHGPAQYWVTKPLTGARDDEALSAAALPIM